MKTKLALAALCALSVPAYADDGGDFYASLGGGAYRVKADGFNDTAAVTKLMGGYNFNQYVAVEAAYLRLFESSDTVDGIPLRLDGNVWDLSTKLSYPFSNRIQGYTRLGWSYYDLAAKASAAGFDVRANEHGDDFAWAAGANVDLTKRIGLRGEYSRIMIDDGKNDYLSLNLTYRIGAH